MLTQQKTVVEKKCQNIPFHECKVQTEVISNPINTTECKTVKENKCQIVTLPKDEQECSQGFEKECRKRQKTVTEIVQVKF